MSFPALMLASWGIVSLRDLLAGDTTRALVRVVIPVMALHTLLWIGVNADTGRATLRLEQLLLGDTNQSTHYRYWTLGYNYLEQDDTRALEAAEAFARAIANAPAEELNTPGTRTFSYRKFYAGALARSGRNGEALRAIRDVYLRQRQPYDEANDIALHFGDGRHRRPARGRGAVAPGRRPLVARGPTPVERLCRLTVGAPPRGTPAGTLMAACPRSGRRLRPVVLRARHAPRAVADALRRPGETEPARRNAFRGGSAGVILPPRALRRVHPLLGMGMALTLQDVLATVQARATHSSRV